MNKHFIVEIEMTEAGEIKRELLSISLAKPSPPWAIEDLVKKAMSKLPEDSYDIPTLRGTLEQKYGWKVHKYFPDISISDAK